MNAQRMTISFLIQVSGVVKDELDGYLPYNVRRSYSPCVCLDSRPEQVFFVLVIISREKAFCKTPKYQIFWMNLTYGQAFFLGVKEIFRYLDPLQFVFSDFLIISLYFGKS